MSAPATVVGTIDSVFGLEGALAEAFPGYQPREGQRRMAELIRDGINDQRTLVIEAGTGIGKTFGYLVPALLAGKKTIVSTGTKHLQDQLFFRDLPAITERMGVSPRLAMLKGRSNYLCAYRLERTRSEALFKSKEWVHTLNDITQWAARTKDGDIARCDAVSEDHAIWPLVTSTVDNCLGGDCPLYENCHVVAAREKAAAADLVVINHHLFCADLAIREEGFAELLPQADVVVFDEAHQLPETAMAFFGDAIGSNQIRELAKDTAREVQAEAADMSDLVEMAAGLDNLILPAHRSLTKVMTRLGGERVDWTEIKGDDDVQAAFDRLQSRLELFTKALGLAAPRGKGLASCHERAEALYEALKQFRHVPPVTERVRWVERREHSFTLNTTPLDVGQTFTRMVSDRSRSWVFTSATLAAGGNFTHFTHRMGLHDAGCHQLPSPFDYASQSLMYLPPDLPNPKDDPDGHTLMALRAVYPVLKASEGRAFLLFTSHRALKKAAEILEGKLPFPMFVQGSASKAALLADFRASGNGVLLGTQSFWEGVDVRGEALSVVMIDKIPFASPGDPVRKARENQLKQAGQSPFGVMALPEAIITFKQGVGRLIRDMNDRGVLVLCDPRLQFAGYGRQILDALPPMRRTRDVREVKAFFAEAPEVVSSEQVGSP